MPFIIINESKEGKAEESEVQAGEEEQGEERVSRPLTNKERRQAKSAAKRATAQATPTKTLASDAQPSGEKKKRKRVEMADSGAEQPAQEGATKRAEAGEEGPGGAGAGGEEDEEEVEALSHKERRKRKKLEKAAARSGEAGDGTNGQPSNVPAWGPNAPNPAAAAAAQAKRLPRSNFSIWVGNLSFQTSTDRLKSWLEEQGCEGISRLHMPAGAKRGEHNKGFAYVDLPSSEAVTRAVSLSESHLDGRRLLIKPGNDFAGRPALPDISLPGTGAKGDDEVAMPGKQGKTGLTKTAQRILRAQKNPAAPTLFMGNLSFETTEDNIKEMLERAARAREAWKKGGADGSDDEDSDDGNRRGKKGKGKGKARSSDSAKPEDGAKEDEDSGSGSDSESDSGDESESESDEQSEDENEDGEKKSKKMAAKAKGERKPKKEASDGPRGAGIRKIRMGTFEDTGKCKGFAFVDFHTVAHSTASLIDPRNSHLDGRAVILQYAGADAVRRGAVKGSGAAGPARSGHGRGAGGAPTPYQRRERNEHGFQRKRARPFESAGEEGGQGGEVKGGDESAAWVFGPTGPAPGPFDPNAPVIKRHKETQEERRARREGGRGGNDRVRRQRPGAALASAPRASVGIVQSAGTKTTFES